MKERDWEKRKEEIQREFEEYFGVKGEEAIKRCIVNTVIRELIQEGKIRIKHE